MMPASSWTDLVVGLDVHLHQVPTPVGLVPTLLPQPFLGMVGDPASELVGAMSGVGISLMLGGPVSLSSGAVRINGWPATTTNSGALNAFVMPHLPIPPGVAHVTPPTGDASFPMGARKITFSGSSAIRAGDVALSCSDPVRMPTSRVMPLPKGAPVMIDGVPGWDVEMAIEGWAMGKLIRTAFSRASRLACYAARLSGPRVRNLISKGRCFVTGHPVDVATGRVFTDAVDFTMPGPLPFVFERGYFSSWSHRDGPLGRGWSHSLDLRLSLEDDLVVFQNAEGQEIVFVLPDCRRTLDMDQEVFEPISGNTLVRTREGWRVLTADGLVHHFAAVGATLRVARTSRRNEQVGIRYGYDAEGRLATVADACGRVVRLAYDRNGRLAHLLGPDPHRAGEWLPVAVYTYTAEGLLAEVRDALGHSTRYGYDGALMVQETDRNDVSFFWMYDGRGSRARCVRTWGLANGETIYNHKIDHDPVNRTTLVTSSYDAKTLYKLSPLGAVVEIIDALGGKTVRQLDDALRVIAETDPLGAVTRHHFGTRGQLLSTVHADGSRVVMKYDPRRPELMTLMVDEIGGAWRYRHDGLGQLTEVRGPEADAWRRYEWEEGQIAAIVEANGARTQVLERDRGGSAVRVRLPNGVEIGRELDHRGRCIATTDAYGRRHAVAYDAADRVIGVSEPDGNVRTIQRDPLGLVTDVADRQQHIRFTYAGLGKLASREEGGATLMFTWGQEGELRAVRNEAGQDHRFFYDPCLRLEREVGFDLGETRYRRNAAGWETKVERPGAGVETLYEHDVRGRVTFAGHSDGTWARLAYRKDGELVEAANQTTTVRLVRDGLGRVTKELQGDVAVLSFHSGGFRARMESSLGADLALARDQFGNPTSIAIDRTLSGAEPLALEYDGAGLETRRTMPGGVTAAWHRDASGRPTRQDVVAPDLGGFTRDYGWGFDERLTRIADSRFGLSEYRHDARGRLVGQRRGEADLTRALDAVGNVYRTPDQSDRGYLRGGAIGNEGATTFTFDPRGQLLRRTPPEGAGWTYTWDGAGQLTRVTRPDGLQVTFTYDALGRRVGKKAGDVETRWIWDGDVILHELRSDRPMTTWYHEPESFTPIAQIAGGARTHVVADHLGAPTALYATSGALAWQTDRDLFGTPLPGSSTATATAECPVAWPGQYADPETGLHYNRFRYYDPTLGQYISPDPIGLLGGTSAYAYTADPLSLIDPWGLMAMDPFAINFSQRSVGSEVTDYTTAMREGRWDWARSGPLRVLDIEGRWVTYDNRRLMAAGPKPHSWAAEFRHRFNDGLKRFDGGADSFGSCYLGGMSSGSQRGVHC
jgi:RHS repeat-associated protein